MPVPVRFAELANTARLFAIAGALAIALAGCQTPAPVTPPVTPVAQDTGTVPTNPLTENKPTFLNLPNTSGDHTPVRVGIILPFNSATPGVKALAAAMLKSAEMALYESGNKDIILMTAEESTSPSETAGAAVRLLDQGAEILIGPLFAGSVRAISHEARDRGVPVLAFSTDRSVAGDGIFLMGFLPENDVRRVVTYAAAQGHHRFAALSANTAYGDVTVDAFKTAVTDAKGEVADVQRFPYSADAVLTPSAAIVKTDADAIFIPLGGTVLRAVAPALGTDGLDTTKVKLLGTSLWNDTANLTEPTLNGAWFAAVPPEDDVAFNAKYRASFGANPPQLASLSYDAISLVALLAKGDPYKRFTRAALTNPDGFSGADGIFRFMPDGTSERGLAIVAVTPDGFHLVDPAPTTFQKPAS